MKFNELFKKFNLVPLDQFRQDPLTKGIVEHGKEQLNTLDEDNKEVKKAILIHLSCQIQKIYN